MYEFMLARKNKSASPISHYIIPHIPSTMLVTSTSYMV